MAVIPPGIDCAAWEGREPCRPREQASVVLLFVGGDFDRKGGRCLLDAFRTLGANANVRLDVVSTSAEVPDDLPNVTVHRGLTPNSPQLRDLYSAETDVFVFPTRADCLPLAIAAEAMAAGLPDNATHVGDLH